MMVERRGPAMAEEFYEVNRKQRKVHRVLAWVVENANQFWSTSKCHCKICIERSLLHFEDGFEADIISKYRKGY
jgi:hypothetical protein